MFFQIIEKVPHFWGSQLLVPNLFVERGAQLMRERICYFITFPFLERCQID